MEPANPVPQTPERNPYEGPPKSPISREAVKKANTLATEKIAHGSSSSSPSITNAPRPDLSSSSASTVPTNFIQQQIETVQQEKERSENQLLGKLEDAIRSKSIEQLERAVKEAQQSGMELKTPKVTKHLLTTIAEVYDCPDMRDQFTNSASLDDSDANGQTPVTFAIGMSIYSSTYRKALPDILKTLNIAGANLNASNSNGWNPATAITSLCLFHPEHRADLPDFLKILKGAEANLDTSDNLGFTPATCAIVLCIQNPKCRAALPGILNDLKAAGANLDASDSRGFTPATYAIGLCIQSPEYRAALPGILNNLKAAGANLDASDSRGFTPATYVTTLGKGDPKYRADLPDVLIMLKDVGAILNADDTTFANSVLAQIEQSELIAFVNAQPVTQGPTQAENTVVQAVEKHVGTLTSTDRANALQLVREAWSLGLIVTADCLKLVRDREKFLTHLVQANHYTLVPLPTPTASSPSLGEAYNTKVRQLLVQYVQDLGLKLPKSPPPFSPESIIDLDTFLHLIGMRNSYAEIPPSKIPLNTPDTDALKYIAHLYNPMALQKRQVWISDIKQRNQGTTIELIQKVTKQGLIQMMPISVQTKLGEGTYKIAHLITLFKGTAPKLKVLAVPKSTPGSTMTNANAEMQHECAVATYVTEKKSVKNIIHMREVTSLGPNGSIQWVGALMDLYSGGDLHIYLRNNPGLGSAQRKTLAIELLTALAGLHKNGLCHCDLKLPNVFVKLDQGEPHVVLADLGTLVQNETKMVSFSSSYPTPEQAIQYARDHKAQLKMTEQLDLWALGGILARLRQWSVFPLDPGTYATKLMGPPVVPESEVLRRFNNVLSVAQKEAKDRGNNSVDAMIALLFSPEGSRPSAQEVLDTVQRDWT